MSNNVGQQTKRTARVRRLHVAALVLASAFVTVSDAAAQKVTPPPTPPSITPPPGNSAFLVGHASGTHGSACLPTSQSAASWTAHASRRPRLTLFETFFGQ